MRRLIRYAAMTLLLALPLAAHEPPKSAPVTTAAADTIVKQSDADVSIQRIP